MADQKPVIFISHTGADVELANAVDALVKKVFGGAITVWHSSDRSPFGGIKPGDEWFASVHGQLRVATRVFALVTPRSIVKPWIYWESGIGSVFCPGRVVPVLFKMNFDDLPFPLKYFQSIDGLDANNFADNLKKIAFESELTPYPEWVIQCVSEFIQVAEALMQKLSIKTHTKDIDPLAALYGPLQNIAERLDSIEKEITRIPERPYNQLPKLTKDTGLSIALLDDALLGNDDGIHYLIDQLTASNITFFGIENALRMVAKLNNRSVKQVDAALAQIRELKQVRSAWDEHEDGPPPGPQDDE